jgi:hypothetical protein
MATTKNLTSSTSASRNVASELPYLTRALKAPSLAGAVERLAERARSEGWTHEEFLAACLQREVAAREAHGGEGRIRAARFPARKSLEDFDFDHQRSLKREAISHLGTLWSGAWWLTRRSRSSAWRAHRPRSGLMGTVTVTVCSWPTYRRSALRSIVISPSPTMPAVAVTSRRPVCSISSNRSSMCCSASPTRSSSRARSVWT